MNLHFGWRDLLIIDVSIHIRHCWRMNFLHAFCQHPSLKSFNPHSPLLANEFAQGPRLRLPGFAVSIHIRHCWRMNCGTRLALSVSKLLRFNPHSPLLANELPRPQHRLRSPLSFNPHSPLLANEFDCRDTMRRWAAVSIHIRHCWRMNCDKGASQLPKPSFQSTFAIAGE